MCFHPETLGKRRSSLSTTHPLSPSTLVNFLIHISLRKVGESTFSFSFGVDTSQ